MKVLLHTLRTLFILVCLSGSISATSQVVSSDICNSLGQPSEVSLKDASGAPLTAIKSGLEFNLILDVPGGICQGGHYDVSITTSPNLLLGSPDPNYPFISGMNANQYVNAGVITSTLGQGINIPFKFKPGVTCDGEVGTFNVTVTLTCGDGSIKTCIFKQISLKALAQNYWVVQKKHVWGDLRGGNLIWDISIINTNPSPGIGDYNLVDDQIQDMFPSGTIVSVVHYSGGGSVNNLTGIGTSLAKWTTGNVSSNAGSVVYRVTTTSCSPVGAVVKNCINIYGSLGKMQFPLPSCAFINNANPICDEVTLKDGVLAKANFSKTLSFSESTLNYAPGCEAEYTIRVSNDGNIPLNNIVINDPFPTGANGINVTKVTIGASGVNMNYITNLGTPASGNLSLNTVTQETWNTANPASLQFNTTGVNMLLGGYIEIRIRFTISPTAAIGSTINNCANLTYDGNYNGGGNGGNVICNVAYPPATKGKTDQSCVKFKVQTPKPVPGITKCIRNGQQSFEIGDVIPFRIVISNHGASSFSGNLTDLLGNPQNLELVPGSITYSSGTGAFSPYSTTPGCRSHFSPSSTNPPSWVTVTQQTQQQLKWTLNNMPGDCSLDQSSYLVIEFDAKAKPQSFGNYCNNTALVSTGNAVAVTYNGTACYNIRRSAKILTTKTANPEFVEPGQTFNYVITVNNSGSVALKNVKVEDVLPSCVSFVSRTAAKIDVTGNATSVTISPAGPPPYTFPGLILQPGESVQVTLSVTRNAGDQAVKCCNQQAVGRGTTDDAAAQNISCINIEGPVCVKSALCCDIKDANVFFATNYNNNAIMPTFLITSGSPIPIQEIEISLIDYHVEYSNISCKPANMGNLSGHIQPAITGNGAYNFANIPPVGSPSLALQTVINPVNNVLTWSGTTPISVYTGGGWNFNGLIALKFVSPGIINLDCCKGTVYYCFKVRIKDVNCNVCEKIVCGDATIPKKKIVLWKDDEAKEKFEIQSLNESDSDGKEVNKAGMWGIDISQFKLQQSKRK